MLLEISARGLRAGATPAPTRAESEPVGDANWTSRKCREAVRACLRSVCASVVHCVGNMSRSNANCYIENCNSAYGNSPGTSFFMFPSSKRSCSRPTAEASYLHLYQTCAVDVLLRSFAHGILSWVFLDYCNRYSAYFDSLRRSSPVRRKLSCPQEL